MANTDQFDFQVLQLVNVERAKYNLNPLTFNEKLDVAADRYSQRMAYGDFFSHNDPNGSTIETRVQQTGYQYTSLGENLAVGQITPQDVVQDWMNSPGHRANILNPNYTHMGLGYFYLNPDGGNVNYQHYWTQVFAAGDNSNSSNNQNNSGNNQEFLGNLYRDESRFGWVGNSDTFDTYSFSLGSYEGVNITLSGLSADADIRLIQDYNNNQRIDSGEIIASSTNGGISSEYISGIDRSGDYYLQVYQYSGETNYQLNFDHYNTTFA